MDMVLFGPPGAGKGTQAKLLVDLLKIPQISTGDIMRAERASGSELGKKFDSYMTKGLLVPDELVLELLAKRLSEPDAAKGALFDGYPRTLAQAEALDKLLAEKGRKIAGVISIEVSLQEMINRIVGRRSCEKCGQIFHLRYNPPPSPESCSCGGKLIQRKDDTEEVVRKRNEEYLAKTAPLLDYYGAKKLVKAVNGVGSLEEVTARIKKVIGVA